MKFLCKQCEGFMVFQKAEEPARDSLGITFACPGCGTAIVMITNAGETNLVNALGVKVGGRETPQPFEFTRSTLKTQPPVLSPQSSSGGKCPFPDMVARAREEWEGAAPERGPFPAPNYGGSEIAWTESAKSRLENIPSFVKGFAKETIEQMAREDGLTLVDDALMDKAKTRFM